MVYDGLGGAPFVADVAISSDRIAAIGALGEATAITELDVHGLAVAPGFINMLSWAVESLIADGKAQSDIRQGVTLEVMGEGDSMGPFNAELKQLTVERQVDIKFDVTWTTLGEYLEHLEKKGVAPNIASVVGASTVRMHELGQIDRAPTPDELDRMRELVRKAMREGALGLGSALMYPPGIYAKTSEIVELCKVVSEYGGIYITHMRSEGSQLLEAIDEVLTIAREANVPAEIYHLKASGKENWPKMKPAIAKIEAARKQGLRITANMYTYPAAGTGLAASMPPWSQEGGHKAFVARMKDPVTRARIARDMTTPGDAWDNWFLGAGPEGIYPGGFKNDTLRPLAGKSLAEIAKLRGKPADQVAMDLIIENDADVGTLYFLMSEDNIRTQLRLPWISFGSDAESPATEGVFLKSPTHPRAYGNFARWLGKYVRDEKVVSLEDAIRRMTSLPAANLNIKERGTLKPKFFADVVVFDPATIHDHATFDEPHQYSTGVKHVFVNGTQVLRDGEHTGKTPGRVVRGPGYGR
ncbi:MAG: D-aminoacylase [Deltaproteobacteria bacterium]|nr:D-aminoacylase [Deltaproteobacteria bacterium]